MTVERDTLRDWHRLFGLLLTDFFRGSPFVVEIEHDLSQQQQFLDVVIVRRRRGKVTEALPDGLGDLAEHNLITFKSHREALDDWAIRELIAHYVAYRKLVSPTPSDMLAADHFHLYAVAARFPHNLAGQVPWEERQPGVYDCRWALDVVRVLVAGQLPRAPQNAPLHLFSASAELVGYGQSVYRQHSAQTSLLLRQLFEKTREEGVAMTYTMEDFVHQFVKEHFEQLSPEEQREALERLSPEHRIDLLRSLSPKEQREALERLSPEHRREVLRSLPPEERLEGLSVEERLAGLSVEERLAGLSEEEARQLLEQLAAGRPAKSPKRRRNKS